MRAKMLGGMVALGLAMTAGSAAAGPAIYGFSYTVDGTTYGFGTMTVSVASGTSLQVAFDAAIPAGVTKFQVTGFAFDFAPERSGLTVSNPGAADLPLDQDGLNWRALTRLKPIPNPSNTDDVTKKDFEFGVTEGKATKFNPPGIEAGETDVFFLGGFTGLTAGTNVGGLIDYAGIRIQALSSPDFTATSLFLVGATPTASPAPTAIPAPGALALFGAGLAGLGLALRRRRAAAG